MLHQIIFKDFRSLRETTLDLGHLTIVAGAVGSGKSSILSAVGHGAARARDELGLSVTQVRPFSAPTSMPEVHFKWAGGKVVTFSWPHRGEPRLSFVASVSEEPEFTQDMVDFLRRTHVLRWKAADLRTSVPLEPDPQLAPSGLGLAAVLDDLRDRDPEAFDELNQDLGHHLPSYDQILFENAEAGRAILLRRRDGVAVPARALSEGELSVVGYLTLPHLSPAPRLVAIKDPTRHLHPALAGHLMRHLVSRLSDEEGGSAQLLVTTHSAHLIDEMEAPASDVVVACTVDFETSLVPAQARPEVLERAKSLGLGRACLRVR